MTAAAIVMFVIVFGGVVYGLTEWERERRRRLAAELRRQQLMAVIQAGNLYIQTVTEAMRQIATAFSKVGRVFQQLTAPLPSENVRRWE
jgi:hypothetical protein